MPKTVEPEYTKNVVVALPEYLYNYLVEVTAGKISKSRYIRNWIEFEYTIDKETKEKKGE